MVFLSLEKIAGDALLRYSQLPPKTALNGMKAFITKNCAYSQSTIEFGLSTDQKAINAQKKFLSTCDLKNGIIHVRYCNRMEKTCNNGIWNSKFYLRGCLIELAEREPKTAGKLKVTEHETLPIHGKTNPYIVVNKNGEKRYKKTANIKGIKYTEGRNGSKERLYFNFDKLEREATAWLEQNKERALEYYYKLLNVKSFCGVSDGTKTVGVVMGYLGNVWIDTDNVKVKQLYRAFEAVYNKYMLKTISNMNDFKPILKEMDKNGCPLGGIIFQDMQCQREAIHFALEYGADFGYITYDQNKKYCLKMRERD